MDKFWTKVLPACATDLEWGDKFVSLNSERQWGKSLGSVLQKMDEEEFNIFLAKVVIRASGAGVVGVELTEKIAWFRAVRSK